MYYAYRALVPYRTFSAVAITLYAILLAEYSRAKPPHYAQSQSEPCLWMGDPLRLCEHALRSAMIGVSVERWPTNSARIYIIVRMIGSACMCQSLCCAVCSELMCTYCYYAESHSYTRTWIAHSLQLHLFTHLSVLTVGIFEHYTPHPLRLCKTALVLVELCAQHCIRMGTIGEVYCQVAAYAPVSLHLDLRDRPMVSGTSRLL